MHWQKIESHGIKPSGRAFAQVFEKDDNLFLIGGSGNDSYNLSEVYLYDFG